MRPSALMIAISCIALVANVACLGLVARHRDRGAHMKASYVFTATDVIANAGVIVAGALVWWTGSHLPDLVIGATIGVLSCSGRGASSRCADLLGRRPAPDPSNAGLFTRGARPPRLSSSSATRTR
jgi:Co/Zn/Cd efflux system component